MKKKILSLMLTLALILSLIPAFTLTASAAGTIHYVKDGGAGSSSGISWDDAFPSLEEAISVADDGDTIFVAKGTYTQTVEYLLDSKDIKIYGSFEGTESSPDERTFASGHSSVLDEDRSRIADIMDEQFYGRKDETVDDEMMQAAKANPDLFKQFMQFMAMANSANKVG
jgi:hypothetical protein